MFVGVKRVLDVALRVLSPLFFQCALEAREFDCFTMKFARTRKATRLMRLAVFHSRD
jgi:hypothetical protein